MNKDRITLQQAVIKTMNSFDIGQQFYGHTIKDRVVELYPNAEHSYVDTIMRVARKVARDKYKCVDMHNGLYERI